MKPQESRNSIGNGVGHLTKTIENSTQDVVFFGKVDCSTSIMQRGSIEIYRPNWNRCIDSAEADSESKLWQLLCEGRVPNKIRNDRRISENALKLVTESYDEIRQKSLSILSIQKINEIVELLLNSRSVVARKTSRCQHIANQGCIWIAAS